MRPSASNCSFAAGRAPWPRGPRQGLRPRAAIEELAGVGSAVGPAPRLCRAAEWENGGMGMWHV
eukprot:9479561-Pyramimonas_sp.AAC.1